MRETEGADAGASVVVCAVRHHGQLPGQRRQPCNAVEVGEGAPQSDTLRPSGWGRGQDGPQFADAVIFDDRDVEPDNTGVSSPSAIRSKAKNPRPVVPYTAPFLIPRPS